MSRRNLIILSVILASIIAIIAVYFFIIRKTTTNAQAIGACTITTAVPTTTYIPTTTYTNAITIVSPVVTDVPTTTYIPTQTTTQSYVCPGVVSGGSPSPTPVSTSPSPTPVSTTGLVVTYTVTNTCSQFLTFEVAYPQSLNGYGLSPGQSTTVTINWSNNPNVYFQTTSGQQISFNLSGNTITPELCP